MSRRKDIVNIRADITEIESKSDTKYKWIQELVLCKDKQDEKPLTILIKKKRERTQINKIRNERREITTDTKEIQRIVRKYELLNVKKLENLDEMDKFLETYNLPKLNQEESENLNRQVHLVKLKE